MCWRLYFKVSPLPFNYTAKVSKIFDMTKFFVLKDVNTKGQPLAWGSPLISLVVPLLVNAQADRWRNLVRLSPHNGSGQGFRHKTESCCAAQRPA